MGRGGCRIGGLTTGARGAGGSSSGGRVVARASSGNGCGAGSCACVCGIDSAGGFVGAVDAGVATGLVGDVGVLTTGFPRSTQPASGIAINTANMDFARCISNASIRPQSAGEWKRWFPFPVRW